VRLSGSAAGCGSAHGCVRQVRQCAVVCGSKHGSVRAIARSTGGSVRAIARSTGGSVCGSAIGSVRQCGSACVAVQQWVRGSALCESVRTAVCGSVWQCVRQYVAVRLVVCGSTAVRQWQCGCVQ
jgi:hypothetical protein